MKIRVDITYCYDQLRAEWLHSDIRYFQDFVQTVYKGRLIYLGIYSFIDFSTEKDKTWFILKYSKCLL